MARILLDSCVWGGTLAALSGLGHEVVWVGAWDRDPGDNEILATAHTENRILVTLDKDFGELAVLKGTPHSGIVRLSGFRVAEMAKTIDYVVKKHETELLEGAIVSVNPVRLRIRAS